jgi:predicted nuclease with TOPRIM domain
MTFRSLIDDNEDLRKRYDELMEKSNEQFKEKCLLLEKTQSMQKAFDVINTLIQKTYDDDLQKLKNKLKVLKDASVLMNVLIQK